MPKGKQPIYTQNLTSSTALITFNNIPQTYTDLEIVCTTRADVAVQRLTGGIRFNNDTSSIYSDTQLSGYITNYSGARNTGNNFGYTIESPGTSATASAFGTTLLYIPNYTSNRFKQLIFDTASPQNTTTGGNAYTMMGAILYRSNAPIITVQLYPGGGGSFVSGSSFTLYGIAR